MNVTDNILRLAYEYRKTKLWDCLYEDNIFALKMNDKKIAYIVVFGHLREDYSVNIYLGESEINKFFSLSSKKYRRDVEARDAFFNQNFLQFSLENSDTLDEHEVDLVRDFKKRMNIKVGGKNSFPMFRKFESYKVPWEVTEANDWTYIESALEACVLLSSDFRKDKFKYFIGGLENNKNIPLFKKKNDGYHFESWIDIPKYNNEYVQAKKLNEIQIRKIKRNPRIGQIACKLIMMPEPIIKDSAPEFVHMLFALEEDSEMLIPSEMETNYVKNPEKIVNKFLDRLSESKINPKIIKVEDKKTFNLLKVASEKLGTNLIYATDLTNLNKKIDEFISVIYEEEMDFDEEDMYEVIRDMSEKELLDLPYEILYSLKMLHDQEMLPKDIFRRINDLGLFDLL